MTNTYLVEHKGLFSFMIVFGNSVPAIAVAKLTQNKITWKSWKKCDGKRVREGIAHQEWVAIKNFSSPAWIGLADRRIGDRWTYDVETSEVREESILVPLSQLNEFSEDGIHRAFEVGLIEEYDVVPLEQFRNFLNDSGLDTSINWTSAEKVGILWLLAYKWEAEQLWGV